MSSQDSFVPDPISTLLLAMQRIWYDRPQRSPEHLLHLIGSTSYHFLDALATLCAFTPDCAAAATVMGSEDDRSRLYISAQPTASPELQALVHKLLDLMQSLPNTPSTVLDVPRSGFNVEKLKSMSLDAATPDHQIIIAVFRACYAKFGESVTGEGGCRDILAALPKPSGKRARSRGEVEKLSVKLNYLLEMVSRDVESVRDDELLRLYYTADDISRSMKRMQTSSHPLGKPRSSTENDRKAISSAMEKMDVLPRAVRHILAGARQERGVAEHLAAIQHSDIQWITSPAPQSFRASTDKDYIRSNFGVFAKGIVLYPPPKTLVREAPRCFTGSAVVHPEAALLGYVCEHKVNMSEYIGASEPTCYPCYMLLVALNMLAGDYSTVDVGRCSFLIPLPWCPPPTMDGCILEEFKELLRRDYATTFEQETAKALQFRLLSW